MTSLFPHFSSNQDILFPGDELIPETEIYSPDDSFYLKMQFNGNLVLYALNSIPI